MQTSLVRPSEDKYAEYTEIRRKNQWWKKLEENHSFPESYGYYP